MSTAAFPRSQEQSMTALVRANEVRHGPVSFKTEIGRRGHRDGLLYAADVLLEQPELVSAMRCYKFLEALPRIGWTKAARILNRHHIYAAKPMSALTDRQRTVLAGELVGFANRLGRWRGPGRINSINDA